MIPSNRSPLPLISLHSSPASTHPSEHSIKIPSPLSPNLLLLACTQKIAKNQQKWSAFGPMLANPRITHLFYILFSALPHPALIILMNHWLLNATSGDRSLFEFVVKRTGYVPFCSSRHPCCCHREVFIFANPLVSKGNK